MDESQREAFDRGREAGRAAGEIAARIAGVEHRVSSIDERLTKVLLGMNDMTTAVQRLGIQDAARDAAAAALRDDAASRRETSERSWSPFQRAFAVLAAIGVLVTIYLALKGGR